LADVSPGELQTLVATLQGMTQQLGNVVKAIADPTALTTFARALSASHPPVVTLNVDAPSGPIAGYLSVNINGTIVKLPYYEG
jgi:hypothetical protein